MILHVRSHDIMSSGVVAQLFGVSEKTVRRWARAELVPSTMTLGGHLRFYRGEIEDLLTRPPLPHLPQERDWTSAAGVDCAAGKRP